ncbi:MAG: efflux RND transporter periplasmic adaptor subunit [Desulforegulaceae bacterium]|nr:efflux RND transporter periplasmic adaptor subunit [Desulforegulaceae bacterium]
MIRSLKKITVTLLILMTGLFMLSGCKNSTADTFTEKEPVIRPVKGFQVMEKETLERHMFPASIIPEKEIRLSFRVGGPIVKMSLETGQKINKGELLAKIDERDFILRIKNLQANINASYAELNDAELQYERYKSLVKENAAAKAKFDQVEAAFKAISSRTKALEKELENAENSLNDTSLYSPVSGYVNEIFTENHETVSAGQPVLSIVKIETIEVKSYIPENLVAKADKFTNFRFCLNSIPGKTFKASLKEIGKNATGAGNTYPIILMAQSDNQIKPGMSAQIFFDTPGDIENDIFTVPLSAVLSNDYETPILWKIDTENNIPVKTEVKIHKLLKSDKIQVSGKLNQGDWIVSAGAAYINEESRIKLLSKFSETNYGNEL